METQLSKDVVYCVIQFMPDIRDIYRLSCVCLRIQEWVFSSLRVLRLHFLPIPSYSQILSSLNSPQLIEECSLLPKSNQLLTSEILGTLPRFQNLTKLHITESLHIKANFELISQLTKLRTLSLRNCRLTKDILSSYSTLKNLEKLDLRCCVKLKGEFGEVLVQLEKLEILKLDTIPITDRSLSLLTSLKKLHKLCILNSSALKGSGFVDLKSLGSLKELRLQMMKWRDSQEDVLKIGYLESLTSLNLCRMNGRAVLGNIKLLRNLKVLTCNDSALTDDIVLDWIQLPLETLIAKRCINHTGKHLSVLQDLQYLDMESHQFPSFFEHITSLTKLKVIGLNRSLSTDKDLAYVTHLTNLRQLYLQDCRYLSDFSPMVKLDKLQVLQLKNNPVKDFSVFSECKSLVVLVFGTMDIPFHHLKSILQLPHLLFLHIPSVPSFQHFSEEEKNNYLKTIKIRF